MPKNLTPDTLNAFVERLQKLADKEFGLTNSGDHRVDVRAINRETHEALHYRPIPHSPREGVDEAAVFYACLDNLDTAHHRFESAVRYIRMSAGQADRQKAADDLEAEGFVSGARVRGKDGSVWQIVTGPRVANSPPWDAVYVTAKEPGKRLWDSKGRPTLRIDSGEYELVP